MNRNFATAMSRALDRVRANNPQDATRLIQAALAGKSLEHLDDAPDGTSSNRVRMRPDLIDLDAEDAEIVDDRQNEECRQLVGTPESGGVRLGASSERPRRHLRDVIDGLSRGRPRGLSQLPGGLALPGGNSAQPAVPQGARYEWRAQSGAFGSREYRLYVPAALPDGPQGLLVMLHGCTQNPDDFASGTAMNTLAEQHGLIVAYPMQARAHNAQNCWNWFRIGDQRRDAGEPAIIAGITRDLMSEFGVERSRVFVAGLSAGGAMAAILGEAYPEMFAAIGVHSGLPAGCASDVLSAFAAMRGEEAERAPRPSANGGKLPRTIVFHGASDATVHPSNGTRIVTVARGERHGTEVQERGISPGGRGYTRTVTHDAHGMPTTEHWLIEHTGHAWSGGSKAGSYTDPAGPDASAEMVRFFLADRKAQ